MIWEGELKGYAKRRNNFTEGTKKAYATIWGICTPTLKSKIEESPDYTQLNTDKNPVRLLEVIRNVVCGCEQHRQSVYSLVQLHKMLTFYYQKPEQSNEAFREEFEALWATFEQQGGCLWKHPGLIEEQVLKLAQEDERDR